MSNPLPDNPTPPTGPLPIVPGQPPAQPVHSAQGALLPPAPPRKRLGAGAIVAIVAGSLVLACCGVGIVSLLVNQRAGEHAAAPQSSTATTGPAPSIATTTTANTPTTPPPPPVPEDQVFEGSGADVIAIDLDPDFAHTATITHNGSSNFAVWTIDANGSRLDLLVNEIGTYSGVRPIDFRDRPAAFQIEADGQWTVVVQALNKAPRWPDQSSGTGSTVLVIAPDAVRGLTTVAITHSGESNFVVWAYGARNSDLLVNEIGSYSGKTILPTWTVAIEIEADGAWAITTT